MIMVKSVNKPCMTHFCVINTGIHTKENNQISMDYILHDSLHADFPVNNVNR